MLSTRERERESVSIIHYGKKKINIPRFDIQEDNFRNSKREKIPH